VVDTTTSGIRLAVARFFKDRHPDDVMLFYFSGHGLLDEYRNLYLASRDTDIGLLSATAIPASFIRSEMDRCRATRQVMMLDCCHGGAFSGGIKAAAIGESVDTDLQFLGGEDERRATARPTAPAPEGRGRVVLTATTATQYAFEGDKLVDRSDRSVFTHFVIEGLTTGAADLDGDGQITIDELYKYVWGKVRSASPAQSPMKWAYGQTGDILISRSPGTRPRPDLIDPQVREDAFSPVPHHRQGALAVLKQLAAGPHAGQAAAAQQILRQVAEKLRREANETWVPPRRESPGGVVAREPLAVSSQPPTVAPPVAAPMPPPASTVRPPAVAPPTAQPQIVTAGPISAQPAKPASFQAEPQPVAGSILPSRTASPIARAAMRAIPVAALVGLIGAIAYMVIPREHPDTTSDNTPLFTAADSGTAPDRGAATDAQVLTVALNDSDSDGDGIPDNRDKCPSDPEDRNGFEDEDGCPDPDNDKDGILGASDKCPLEAETFNRFKDDDGCPDTLSLGSLGELPVAKKPARSKPPPPVNIETEESFRKKTPIRERISFEFKKDVIKAESKPIVEDMAAKAKVLLLMPGATIQVRGHTDDREGGWHDPLSQRRADAVRRALILHGIAPERLRARGYGNTVPTCSTRDEKCWANNRRVDLVPLP
jgi:outer membrane protein OmpA-like peptidoglycan-associated protein